MRFPEQFFASLQEAHDLTWLPDLEMQVREVYARNQHGDTASWDSAMESLPFLENIVPDLSSGRIGFSTQGSTSYDKHALEVCLRKFHPWRKGPFQIDEIFIDSEWRSDWKWDRLQKSIEPLAGKAVLDIGCGSGYHLWKMVGAGARWAIGLEPVDVYVYQFAVLQHFLAYADRAAVLGIPFEMFPQATQFFDTVFSMGVLYHRKSPIEHLEAVRESLKPDGQMVLETLVVEGDENTVLFPKGRYAQMRNVWFLPSVKTLVAWMKRLRFRSIDVVNVNRTAVEEQRSTDWMRFDSLCKFLDPEDQSKTIEGYPSPLRAIITARV
ncbi:MAG: tRNA 5-methoxyuridine(34)/uridine 5-oxyacetic acid(34) synthase CmoB [Verrucomicrobiota bacterium]